MRLLLPASLLLFALLSPAAGAEAPTQRQWLTGLVEGLGWSFGLPDAPQDADYLRILAGDRSLRVEAEAAKQPTDMVSVKDFVTFGEFSGEGWVSGIATPTTARLRFLLPLAGTYRLAAALRLPGHEIVLDGRTFAVDGKERFGRVELGEMRLAAGEHEAEVRLPPNGAVDYLELAAPPLPPVRPLDGWRPDAPLTLDDLAVTAVQLLGLEPLLPMAETTVTVEAEAAADPGGATVTDARHLGQPSGGAWLRAGAVPATVTLRFAPPAPGVYTLLLRGAADDAVSGELNSRFPVTVDFPTYLQTVPAGAYRLEGEESTLRLLLPPRAGLDALQLAGHRSDGADYRRLAGLPVADQGPPDPAQMDALLSLLAAIGPVR